ncbi:MAG: hypothetical protein GY805_27600, partial [Chloroflexi bacterium]|nr:hypothetical protein [Chloroflexota bacterium]
GTFEMYFDGSDVGLSTYREDVDGIGFTPDGRLLISTLGRSRIPQTGGGTLRGYDNQLLVFNDVSFGSSTAGDWEMYFDGRDVGLNREDIGGTWLDATTGDIYMSVNNGFSVDGVNGNQLDIFVCHPITLGENTSCTFEPVLHFDGSSAGYGGNRIDGFSIRR